MIDPFISPIYDQVVQDCMRADIVSNFYDALRLCTTSEVRSGVPIVNFDPSIISESNCRETIFPLTGRVYR